MSGEHELDTTIDEWLNDDDSQHQTEPQQQDAEPVAQEAQQVATTEQVGSSVATDSQDQHVAEKAPNPDDLRPTQFQGVMQDAEGNLYQQNGQLVARAGGERGRFERSLNLQNTFTNMQSYIKQLEDKLQQTSATQTDIKSMQTTLAKAYDVDEQMVPTLMQFGQMAKTNPQGAFEAVVAEFVSKGYPVGEWLGNQAFANQTQLQAMQRLMDERLRPLTEEQRQRQEQMQMQQQVQEQVSRFYATHAYADLHSDLIAQVMQRNNVSAEIAYRDLQLAAQRAGLDFSRDLRQQYSEKQQQAARPVPQAPIRPASSVQNQNMHTALDTSPNATYEDIVRQALMDANMKVDF